MPRDVEEYTINELAFGAIKQLRRIADAIEVQNKMHKSFYDAKEKALEDKESGSKNPTANFLPKGTVIIGEEKGDVKKKSVKSKSGDKK